MKYRVAASKRSLPFLPSSYCLATQMAAADDVTGLMILRTEILFEVDANY